MLRQQVLHTTSLSSSALSLSTLSKLSC